MKIKALGLVGALGLLSIFSAAQASVLGTATVLYSKSVPVQGRVASTATFDAPGAGTVFLTLTDLEFPKRFSSLRFSLSDDPTAKIGLANAGTLELDLTAATVLYANVVAATGCPEAWGLYNLTATFLSSSPVPLPPTGLLLALGGLLLIAWQRLRGGSRAFPGAANLVPMAAS